MRFVVASGRLIFFLFFLPFSIQAQTKIKVIGFTSTECTDGISNVHLLRTRIIGNNLENRIYTIRIGMTETCCLSFKPVVKFYSNANKGLDTLYLGYKRYGVPCECECYYELIYKIKLNKDSNFDIQFKGNPIEITQEKYKTYPVQYEIIGKDTFNLVDKYGLRQGVWTPDSSKINHYYVFMDGVAMRDVVLFANGNIKMETKREFDNWNYRVEYFESGQKKSECYNNQPGRSFRDGTCKEWNGDGQIIYDGPFKKPPP